MPEITLGETVCRKLKDIYFSEMPWISCYRDVAIKLTELKRLAKAFYADKNDLEVLKEFIKYNNMDILEVFNTRNVIRET